MERKIYLISVSADSSRDPMLSDEERNALGNLFHFGFYKIEPVPWYLNQKKQRESVYIGSLKVENPLRPEEVKQLKDYFSKRKRDIECFELTKIG